jgi:8-oxo-dGTP diphosphatase
LIIEVAAGVVFREGKLLITQRGPDVHLANLWEFPGGKREPGETFEQCLHRELAEELGIEANVGNLVESLTHHYPERSVQLKFFLCRWLRHEPRPIDCVDLAWITQGELGQYEFPAADVRLLENLRSHWPAWAASVQ